MEPSSYGEVFETFTRKSRYQQRVVDFLIEYFRRHPSYAKRIRNVLSVGSGEGEMDIPLMRHCLPNVIYYCGIEPRINAIDKFQDNLLKNGSKDLCIKTEFHSISIKDFQTPCKQVDLIIIGHVMYYVMDDFQSIIEKCITWLNPGGMILLSHSAPHELWLKIGDVMNGDGIDYRQFHSIYRQCMKEMKQKGHRVEDHRVKDAQVDFSEPSTESAIKLVTNKSDIDNKQMDLIKQIVSFYSSPGTMKFSYEIMITIICKEQE